MAQKSRIEKAEFEKFEIVLDGDDVSMITADPAAYFRKLLTSWGIPINALCIDGRLLQKDKAVLREGTVTTIYHCTAPADQASRTMIVTRPQV